LRSPARRSDPPCTTQMARVVGSFLLRCLALLVLILAETLRRNGPPPYIGDGLVDKYVAYIDVLNNYMGEPHYRLVVPIVPLFAPEYGLADKLNHTRGLIESFEVVYP